MTDLIEKLEHATGPDRLLDGLIMAATNPPNDLDGKPANIFIRHDGDYGRFKRFAGTPMSFSKMVPQYTASIDAALKLVRPAHEFEVGSAHLAECYWASIISAGSKWDGNGKSPAVALCIAALKSRN